jgi:type IV pilus assembly protein PilM
MSIFGASPFLVVDIGTTSIKVGEFINRAQGVELLNYGLLESQAYLDGTGSAIQTSSFRMLEPLVIDYLKRTLRAMGTKTKRAYVALPAFSAFTTLIELPEMSIEDTERAIPFQSQQYIPAPLASVAVEWFSVGTPQNFSGSAMQQIFLVSVSKNTLKKYERVLRGAGLKMAGTEVESMSLARVASQVGELVLIADIGSRSTSLCVAESGVLKFSAQTDFASGSLTQVLANGLNITLNRAESLKNSRGLAPQGGEQGLSTLMAPMLDAIISEATRALTGFERSFGQKVNRVVLSGGGARLIGVEKYFSDELNLPTTQIRPFERISYPSALSAQVSELSSQFAVVIGLALKPK